MRRLVLAAVILLVVSGVVAQESPTDAANGPDPLAGTTVESLGGITPTAAPDCTELFLRITMQPGAVIPAHHHPGAVVVVVRQGLFGTDVIEGGGTVTRAGQVETETVQPGSDVTLEPGDSLAYEGTVHTMRNDGDEPLVLLVAALLDPNQPGFIFQQAIQDANARNGGRTNGANHERSTHGEKRFQSTGVPGDAGGHQSVT